MVGLLQTGVSSIVSVGCNEDAMRRRSGADYYYG